MKIKLPEHDHKLTNILKVLLFSLLMLLPFLDIGTRCGYVLLNKNAYHSYSGTQEVYVKDSYNTNEVNNYNDLVNGNYYQFYFNDFNQDLYWSDLAWSSTDYITTRIYGYNVYNLDTPALEDFSAPLLDSTNNEIIARFYLSSDSSHLYFFGINNDFQNCFEISLLNGEGNYFIIQYNESIFGEFASRAFNTYHANFFNSIVDADIAFPTYSKQNSTTLDNVFDYSIDKMANSPLYNWTTQTGMYTGVNAMTTGLGITTPLFAILITYWMFLTIIYIILDIVLSLFTFMTHIFTKKE